MNEGFPKQYDILPAPVERGLEVIQRLGRFLFTTPEVHPYMSEHFRGAEEMLASIEPTPVERCIAELALSGEE
jgi:hypothetical protein